MAIIQTIPLGKKYGSMTSSEAQAGTNTESQLISAKVLNDQIDEKISDIGLATVATSGSYNDLSNKPTIPTKTSELTNDSNFLTSHQDISGKADKSTSLSGYGITNAYTKTEVDNKISSLVNSAPETLDTLNELASALGNDPNFATTIANQIGTKANDSDVVHKSGNETINGTKTFSSSPKVITKYPFISINNSECDITSTPSETLSATLYFSDKNGKNLSYIVSQQRGNGENRTCYRQTRTDADGYYSVCLSTNGSFYPEQNNTINLGTSTNKWKDVYATTFNGSLVGNADTSTKATNNASGNELSNDIIKGLSVSGKVITYTKLDGSTGTITTQDNNTWTAFKGATSSANGTAGYVPAPTKGNQDKFFKADGTWATPTDTTYSVATQSADGLMSSSDKTKLDGLSNYELPTASSTLGGVKTTSTVTSTTGFTACPIISGVPYYKDTNTTYTSMTAAEATTGTATTARTITAKVLNDKIKEMVPDISGLATDNKVVHLAGTETITGTKTFNSSSLTQSASAPIMSFKALSIDGTALTSSTLYGINFTDKNDTILGYVAMNTTGNANNAVTIQASCRNTDNTAWISKKIGLYTYADGTAKFTPSSKANIDLGDSQYKWKDVYATTFHGDIDFDITESDIATIVV